MIFIGWDSYLWVRFCPTHHTTFRNVNMNLAKELRWRCLSIIACEITSNSTVYSDVHQRKHQSSELLALCEGNPPGTGGFPSQRASNTDITMKNQQLAWMAIIYTHVASVEVHFSATDENFRSNRAFPLMWDDKIGHGKYHMAPYCLLKYHRENIGIFL